MGERQIRRSHTSVYEGVTDQSLSVPYVLAEQDCASSICAPLATDSAGQAG
jgi:hypothetical protein